MLKKPPVSARDIGLIPGQSQDMHHILARYAPYGARQLSSCATTIEPVL